MSRFNFKASSQQIRRKPYVAIAYLNGLIEPGVYAGFWDIVQEGGALDQNDVQCQAEGDQVFRLPQLLPDGTASDVVFKDPLHFNSQDPAEFSTLTFRRGLRLFGTKYSNPRIPFLYYPKGVLQAAAFDGNISQEEMPAVFKLGNGDLGTPPLWEPTTGFAYGFFGCKATTEMGDFGAVMDETAGPEGFMGLNEFPAPMFPGTVIYNSTIVGDDITTDTYINGVKILTEVTTRESSTMDNDGLKEAFRLIGLFCWAVQKYFVISKPLTLSEINEVHEAFIGTMESFK